MDPTPEPGADAARRYRAFLSYSHADARWARRLSRALEGYRLPATLVGTNNRMGQALERGLGKVFRDRDELAVVAIRNLAPVNRAHTFHERGRIDHVARAARMNDELRFRQLLHQQARTAGVIEMHVRQDHVVDAGPGQAEDFECLHQARDGVIRSGVHEGGAAVRDDQVTGIEEIADEAGIDDVDVVVEALNERGRCVHDRSIRANAKRTIPRVRGSRYRFGFLTRR